MNVFPIRQAAELLGVSDDTLRRWAESGRLTLSHQPNGRLGVEGAELARVAAEASTTPQAGPIVGESARNRFTGIVTRVVRDKVMAQVEMQAGRFRVVSLMSREAADDLRLEPGMLAVAAIKSTNVIVEVPRP